ncbi:hypothetical protein LCGC14_1103560 [marine sediment metagenome]|uniref:Uncharacterized protein n=1 Tax=marine sediment metagenome TaxID=412755 RepID=A0A0F9MDB9_9ZZZZ
MNPPAKFTAVINRKRYSIQHSTLIADDVYWNGHNMERSGHNRFLYRTKNGTFFAFHMTMWIGESDRIEALSETEAYNLYEGPLSEHHVSADEAFPNITIADA